MTTPVGDSARAQVDSEPPTLPINRGNLAAIVASFEKASEQAREAIAANGPRIAAALEQMHQALSKARP